MPRSRETPAEPGLFGALPARFLLLFVLAALLRAAPGIRAQNVLVDQGTFLLSREGRPVGTETFTIRRSGSGSDVEFIATSSATLDSEDGQRKISSALEARGGEERITAYQLKESGSGRRELYMTLTGDRYQATVRTPGSEQLREFRARPATVILEDELVYAYYFLAARINGATVRVPALMPRTGQEVRLEISDTGTERISIAGRNIPARHLVVEGGGDSRDLWVDGEGRVLRLAGRSSGLRAERRDPPT